jgi:phosphoglycolate phosphatase-like HAD superfamily hydrolase
MKRGYVVMYKMILFDVDGVFLSEERCFDTTALTVWELLNAPHFLGLAPEKYTIHPDDQTIRQIRKEVFQEDRILDWLKTRGVNSNWDMSYMIFSSQLLSLLKEVAKSDQNLVAEILQNPITNESLNKLRGTIKEKNISFTPQFDVFISLFDESEQVDKHELLVYWNRLAKEWFDLDVDQFSRNSALWALGRSVFQEWYLGEKLYREVEKKEPFCSGKTGFLSQEIPLADPKEIYRVLKQLRDKGITLGIGTGRTELETVVPLTELGFFSLFDANRVVSASQVVEAEEAYPEYAPLGKPEPFTYIKGYLGRSVPIKEALDHSLPLENGSEVLIVGDSVADLIAARKMGCHFAATLTGLTGQAARAKFEELGADYIIDDVTKIFEISLLK